MMLLLVGMSHKSGFRSYPLTTSTKKNFICTVSRSGNSAKSIERATLSNKNMVKYLLLGSRLNLRSRNSALIKSTLCRSH